jgi:predicted dienelactone hydrolase
LGNFSGPVNLYFAVVNGRRSIGVETLLPRRLNNRIILPVKRVLVLVVPLLMLSACGGESDADPEAPQPTTLDYAVGSDGPFKVGYRTLPVSYVPRSSTESREILIHIWYPTQETTTKYPIYAGIISDEASNTGAVAAAPVGGQYPVHVHSHGHMGFGGASAFLMRYFASHGWVAVAPDHTGNTLLDNIEPRPLAIYHQRSQDIAAALDAVAALGPDDPLSAAHTSKVLLSGHSFGVHTCWASAGATFDMNTIAAGCTADSCPPADLDVMTAGLREVRVAAVIPMAGAINRDLFGKSGHEGVTIPMLSMSGGNDPVGADKQFADAVGVGLTWIDIDGACHQTFGLGACDTLEADEGFAIVNTYALAFARKHILDDTGNSVVTILDGTKAVSERVSFEQRTP